MVGNTALPPDASLRDVLVARARASSDARLVVDVAGGLLVLVVVAAWHPRGWLLASCAALCFAAFGAWGISDRELSTPDGPARRWQILVFRAIRVAAVVLGVLAAAALVLQLFGLALGTWIS